MRITHNDYSNNALAEYRIPDGMCPIMKNKSKRRNNMKHLTLLGLGLIIFLIAPLAALSQNTSDHPTTDSAKIADALRAGPPFITKSATILDWPSKPGGEYRLLRRSNPSHFAQLFRRETG